MQEMSTAYKKAMKQPLRDRAYGKVYIGVFNSEATNTLTIPDNMNSFTYFSDKEKVKYDNEIKEYATAEENFARVDGFQYFLPPQSQGYEMYNNGIVTNSLMGSIYITFGTLGLDIKGLTIDFGDNYPTSFKIKTNKVEHTYSCDKNVFVTEDVFEAVEYFQIIPLAMKNSNNTRLRIYSFLCGIGNTFTNEQLISITCNDYISSITDSIPSRDMTVKVVNNDRYYSPDNPDSTLAFFEIGQEIKINFGMTLEDGTVEWTPIRTAFLKSWSADDTTATFTATDRFDNISSMYYRGKLGLVTLYSLAQDVFNDMGLTSDKYTIADFLRNIYVSNPMPPVRHSEALQIIANAGRCVMYEDKDNKINISSTFLPELSNAVGYHYDTNTLPANTIKNVDHYYAYTSLDTIRVDGKAVFRDYTNADVMFASDYDSSYYAEVILNYESILNCQSLTLTFDGHAPKEVRLVLDTTTVKIWNNPDNDYVFRYDKPISNTRIWVQYKTDTNTRSFLKNVEYGELTDYELTYDLDLSQPPIATREKRVKDIKVGMTSYSNSSEARKTLKSEKITREKAGAYNVYFTNPSYNYAVSLKSGSGSVSITYQSAYMVTLYFSDSGDIEYSLEGNEYVSETSFYIDSVNPTGEEIEWKNPLVSTSAHAIALGKWLDDYYLGDVSYKIKWRGDPRTEANDLFKLELRDREPTLVRAYKNSLTYNGAFSGELEVRKAVVE